MPAGFYYKSLALGICFRLITMNVFQWSDGLPIKSFLGGENMNLHLTPDVNQGNKEARWVQDFLVGSQAWIESLWIFCEVLRIESVLWKCGVGVCGDENFMTL